MPGLLGIVDGLPARGVTDRFTAAEQRMLRHKGTFSQPVGDASGSWRVAHITLDRLPPPRAEADGTFALCHGDVFNLADLTRSSGQLPGVEVASPGTVLVALYRQYGVDFLRHLEGSFALTLVDPAGGRVIVATDPLGTHPIYWQAGDEGLVFGSDLSGVLRAMKSRATLDLRAVADYLTFGAVLGDKTLAAGVRLLDPGVALVYDLRTRQLTQLQYAAMFELFAPKATTRQAYIENLQADFSRAVDHSLSGPGPIGLSLSGGLDSRAILSAMNGRATAVRTYTLGVDGCADHVIADRLSKIAGTSHAFFRLDAGYLRDFLPNLRTMVSMSDGMYLTHGLTEMLALQFIDDLHIRVLVRGHGGELAKAHLAWPLHTDAHVYTLRDLNAVASYLSTRANYITPGLSLTAFMTPEAATAAGPGSAASFDALLRELPLSPAQACSYLYLHGLNRRFTVPSLELFRSKVNIRLPYLDQRFLRTLLSAPAEWRDNTDVHKALTAAGIPGLLRVRNSNTGAPADAGPVTEAICDKFNGLFKRLDLRGYRHYHDFDAWMRSMLLESVEAELLAPTSRVLAFVRQDALRKLIAETRSGSGDHAYLLQVLLIIEMWQREHDVADAA